MKHIVWKAYWDFEKEEKFFNEMSAKGLALTDYSWCRYVFEEAPRGEYIYRIELLENSAKHPESQNYIRFMEETGVDFVASFIRWVFFRKKAADGEFNIYSDTESRIKHYKRIRTLFSGAAGVNLAAFAVNLTAVLSPDSSLVNLFGGFLSLTIFALILFTLVLPLTKKIKALHKQKEITE